MHPIGYTLAVLVLSIAPHPVHWLLYSTLPCASCGCIKLSSMAPHHVHLSGICLILVTQTFYPSSLSVLFNKNVYPTSLYNPLLFLLIYLNHIRLYKTLPYRSYTLVFFYLLFIYIYVHFYVFIYYYYYHALGISFY